MKTVLIIMASGSEELEAVTVINILRRAQIKVIVYADSEVIICSRGTKILPDITNLNKIDVSEIDGIVIPGGIEGVDKLSSQVEVVYLTKEMLLNDKMIAAICAAPKLMKDNNLLEKDTVLTSHPSIKEHFNDYEYIDEDVVIYDNFITSKGAGTSLDFAFAIVETLLESDVADKIKEDICYPIYYQD